MGAGLLHRVDHSMMVLLRSVRANFELICVQPHIQAGVKKRAAFVIEGLLMHCFWRQEPIQPFRLCLLFMLGSTHPTLAIGGGGCPCCFYKIFGNDSCGYLCNLTAYHESVIISVARVTA